jgi:Ca2+-binding EF-hand superfamily protein
MRILLLQILFLYTLLLVSRAEQADDEVHRTDFISFDSNGDNRVDPSEVRRVFPHISQEELSAFFISSDKNEDGLIDYDEYLHASLENEDGNLNLEEFQMY